MAAGRAGQLFLKLSAPEVVNSVKSLYADELKPFGRVLLRRLRERAAESQAAALGLAPDAVDPETMPRIDPKQLRKVCQRSQQLRVEPEDGHEFSVILAGRPLSFLDVCSPLDPYPQGMWLAAAAYFQSLGPEDMYLPGGRYACAHALVGRTLPFFAGYSLGQVCHIVQLAISQKRVLGHMKGHLVPYSHSEGWLKEQHAFHGQPLSTKQDVGSLPIATWEEVEQRLLELLETESNPEPGVVTLSNVKRLFRSRFHVELSETALGHSRLFDLLHDVRLRDVCIVQSQGSNGQLLVKRKWAPRPQMPKLQISTPDYSVQTPAPQAASTTLWTPAFAGSFMYPAVPMQMNSLPPPLAVLKAARFDLDMTCELGGLSPGASPRSSPRSIPNPLEDAGDCFKVNPGSDEDSGDSTDFPWLRDSASSSDDEGEVSPQALLTAQALQTAVKNTFIEVSLPEGARSGCKRRLRSVPRDMYSRMSV